MSLLKGKNILVTGVLTEASIAFHIARLAQEEGATVILTSFGRAMSITQRIAGRLPSPAPVIELDVTNDDHLAALESRLREHVDRIDGVVHSIGFAPEAALGGNFLNTEWADVATAVQVSAFSLKSLTMAARPLFDREKGASVVGLTFDARVAWPKYDWMGVAKAALESCSRYLARDLGKEKVRVNMWQLDRSEQLQRNRSLVLKSLKVSGTTELRSRGIHQIPSQPHVALWHFSRIGSPRPPARWSMSMAASTLSVANP